MTTETAVTTPARTLTDLAQIVRSLAGRPDDWMNRVQLRCGERWFECIEQGPDHDVWLISWLPGQGTGFHDHGGSSGAFAVVLGTLEEHRAGADPLTVRSGEVRAFGSQYAHDVRNASAAPAISIHAYSPPLTRMNKYELAGEQLVPLGVADDTRAQAARTAAGIDSADRPAVAARQKRRSIAEVLDAARARLSRLLPDEAQQRHGRMGRCSSTSARPPSAPPKARFPPRSSSNATSSSGASIPGPTPDLPRRQATTCRS